MNDVGIPCCSLRHRHHGALVSVDMTLEVDDLMTAKSLIEVIMVEGDQGDEVVGEKGEGLTERTLFGYS